MKLPQDPVILMSMLNTLLRDKYASFDELCDDMELNREEILKKLSSFGFIYKKETNQFR